MQILLFRYEIKTTLFILSSKLLLESTILYSILQPEWSETGKHKVTTSSVTNSSDEIIFVKRNRIKIGIKIPNPDHLSRAIRGLSVTQSSRVLTLMQSFP